jgi:hypothetical protein
MNPPHNLAPAKINHRAGVHDTVSVHQMHVFIKCTRNIKHLKTCQTSTLHNSTTMSPIEEALLEIESLKPGEDFQYTTIARRHGVHRSTLSRRHRAVTASRAAVAAGQQKITPQQEAELVKYIEGLTARHLPPTREMI